ncbi:MAG: endonuclease/exonuclease/phosphatase family protein [Deltaproteobacteria bacterium]|nr:endonuclease/exonuclease/phosphatase family protein [Deltaproteobacteria bacterium]
MGADTPFTVVSWNVLADAYVKPAYFPYTDPAVLDPASRRPRVVDRLVSLVDGGADVICLQELEPDFFETIRGALPSFEGRYTQKAGKPDGCAVLVRRALGAATFRDLTYRDGTGGVAVVARVEPLGCSIATTHLKWQAADVPPETRLGRGELIELFEAWIAPGERWVVCGDLNAPYDSPVLDVAFSRGFDDAYASMPLASTCNSNARAKRIDFILHTRDLRATPSPLPSIDDMTPLPSSSEPSDHLAIRAVLEPAVR